VGDDKFAALNAGLSARQRLVGHLRGALEHHRGIAVVAVPLRILYGKLQDQ
jgi:hypothetical protein